ncbi:MAG: hypothetical protein A3A44_01465 [Candidatus Sungbacteria bacterium RIFCSPLOWO2_01_FULL_60_25]|uniref:Uncharacterized protein n=1 Tax=Candidatus Sungbacteria bacterium RIFCSPLOWO2_01_FULL_60_25 TaxID=1802281 RepID=A0A1G2LC54_9BACT|nr:MAG: hypothetical protein A3A44_01465 [Candidatus Sungbacteria bacterium RIFCSPLOWO2_01_FULL_60_25]
MRLLFYGFLLAGGVWAFTRYVSPEMRHNALARVGLARFVEETAPNYLREKFIIREDPAEKRAKLLAELSAELDAVGVSVDKLVPISGGGTPKPLPRETVIREEATRIREAIEKSETILGAVEDANQGSGIIGMTTARLLDAILPAPSATGTPAACPAPSR